MRAPALLLVVLAPERNLAADTSPKPTVFLPSIAEINHDNAGTYLCLLEKFFPDVITVSWRVKNDKRALPSQQGNTMKTKDTYMKLSWLTVTENSMDKQHVCVVKHQKNIGGIDQEIIFPSIKEVVTSAVTTTKPPNDCLTDESKRNLAADTSPKPTVFLPSIAEINHDNAGTYLCLLEKFFPDVITVSWRVKNDKRALPSQQGNTMKTKDTYMKLSWLTVTENSMDKQHVCVVKHQKNIGGIDQEIIFPSIKEEVTGTGSKTACLKDERGEKQHDNQATKLSADCNSGQHRVSRFFTDMVVMVLSLGHQLQDDRWSRSKRSQTKVKYIALILDIWKYLFMGRNNVFPRGAWEKHHSDPDLTSITRPGVEPQGNLSPTTMGFSLGAEGRAVLGRLALLWALVVPGIQQEIRLSQRSVMVGSAGGAMTMPCHVSRSVDYVHWFRQLEGQAPERLLYLALSKRDVQWDSVLGDKNLPTDIVPKPTIFLPSINEVNHQQTATYLCLLENFFPDVIKVSWKEKNGKRVLPSQQGNTMKTNNTYMKFSWLTVTEDSMKKEHMCIVRLEKNAGGKDQEILFPAVNEVFSPVVATTEPPDDCLQDESEVTDTDFTKVCSRGESEVTDSTKACLKDENNTVELQLAYNSAYYTYFLLLLKSAVYFVTTSCCVFRRTGVCHDGKSS
ncbi:hypothetical protein MG293_006541 [Ovis ammon polii]|uniref:Ig-like domain-containing protein n=1 Tax=Ovis ammon polii TaxID=230172 RepID=A0AAD4YDY3_OVIAM|nr:hypothetical protein MG293_006541 [Ovis ammon polii]